MPHARTRVYTDDTGLFWQQLGKVGTGGATLFVGCAVWGIRDAVLWASAAAAVASLAAMILLAWRTRASCGRVRLALDESGLHYRRRRRGQSVEIRDYDLDDITKVQLRMHVGGAQSLGFGLAGPGLPELRIETLSGYTDSFQVVALDMEGCEEFRSFVAHVCDRAGMQMRKPGAGGPVGVVDRWDHPVRVRAAKS